MRSNAETLHRNGISFAETKSGPVNVMRSTTTKGLTVIHTPDGRKVMQMGVRWHVHATNMCKWIVFYHPCTCGARCNFCSLLMHEISCNMLLKL